MRASQPHDSMVEAFFKRFDEFLHRYEEDQLVARMEREILKANQREMLQKYKLQSKLNERSRVLEVTAVEESQAVEKTSIVDGRDGGEMVAWEKVNQHKLCENESRRYFQQFIDAVDYCHSKSVYHMDSKPGNLLLQGNLKVSYFGLGALPQQGVGLLRTTYGTPNYVAPEVLDQQGYDGSASDVWSCGVILFVPIAGYLPFGEADLSSLYRKINAAEFT
ncbi:CBL-interacting protein kinase 24 isoform X2 [Canna indica]|uniref:non-specific serine/threonine protein kinase n=1 Tax=Canna indica TaxID=4628 RepID=A0AAQ3KBH8_9LILI|nr:CBL-interacting protein kinase 24 isoform X2 [Canna indica]